MKCPCFSGKEYLECCAPYHQGEPPPNPIALMRSRYSAYALGNAGYIIKTTHSQHPDKRLSHSQWIKRIQNFCRSNQFTGLEILEAEDQFVTFRAHLGEGISFTEKSEFEKEGGYWRYKKAVFIN